MEALYSPGPFPSAGRSVPQTAHLLKRSKQVPAPRARTVNPLEETRMKRTISISLVVLAAVCLFRASQLLNTAHAQDEQGRHVEHRVNPESLPDNSNAPETNRGNRPGVGDALTTGGTGVVTPAITWHGGPVIATPTIYLIWYGNWNQSNGSDNSAGQNIVRDFASNIGGSPYFQLNTTYSISGTNITGNANLGSNGVFEATDTGSQGTRLRDSSILNIVNSAISGGKLPYDINGVYFVLTSSNISEQSGFCTRYCGWHTANNGSVGHLRYSFVGNANRCLSACAAQTTGPNGNAGVDGM